MLIGAKPRTNNGDSGKSYNSDIALGKSGNSNQNDSGKDLALDVDSPKKKTSISDSQTINQPLT